MGGFFFQKIKGFLGENVRNCFRAGFLGKKLRSLFRETFWEIRPESAGFHFRKYKKRILIRKYKKFFRVGFFRKYF